MNSIHNDCKLLQKSISADASHNHILQKTMVSSVEFYEKSKINPILQKLVADGQK